MEDFIFHLSDSQLIELEAVLKRRQPLIFDFYSTSKYHKKGTSEADFLLRMTMIIFKCFDVYGVEVPRITEKENLKWDKKWKTQIFLDKDNLHYKNLERVGATVNQAVLCRYIFDKFLESDKPVTQNECDKTLVKLNTLNVLILVYGSKIKEILNQQNYLANKK